MPFRRNFVENLDVHVLEALQRRPQIAGRGDVLGQEVIYLVESQITLLPPKIDETLKIFPFMFVLHPISRQTE